MNWSSFWDAISGISGAISLLVMLFLEWDKVKKRWGESAPTFKLIFRYIFIVSIIISFIFLQIGIWSSQRASILQNGVLGEVGLWTYTSLAIIWALNGLRIHFKSVYKDFYYWIALMSFMLTLILTIYIYYR